MRYPKTPVSFSRGLGIKKSNLLLNAKRGLIACQANSKIDFLPNFETPHRSK